MLPALVTAAGGGWVTQMQSKYGATAKHAADIWAGDMSDTDSQVYKTIGYYWHAPQDVDSNRGLGGGIQWAWDDSLCTGTRAGKDFLHEHATLEEQFREGKLFVDCTDIKAAMHRAFKVWEDMHQHIKFVDVTEECRSLYGRVQSNCSLLELFITSRDSYDTAEDVGKPYPFGRGSKGFPLPDPLTGESLADEVTGFATDDDGRVKDRAAAPGDGSFGRRLLSPDAPQTISDRISSALSSLVDALSPHPGRRAAGTSTSRTFWERISDARSPRSSPQSPREMRRRLEESDVELTRTATAAASATQYGRYAKDLRSTNGHVQRRANNESIVAMET